MSNIEIAVCSWCGRAVDAHVAPCPHGASEDPKWSKSPKWIRNLLGSVLARWTEDRSTLEALQEIEADRQENQEALELAEVDHALKGEFSSDAEIESPRALGVFLLRREVLKLQQEKRGREVKLPHPSTRPPKPKPLEPKPLEPKHSKPGEPFPVGDIRDCPHCKGRPGARECNLCRGAGKVQVSSPIGFKRHSR